MQTSSPPRRPATRMLAAFMTWILVFGQVMQPVVAATTPLADVPIAAKVSAKPNIVYTLDDSGSMKLNYLPDYVTSNSGVIPISNITRANALAYMATATGTAANFAPLSVGDQIQIDGVSPAAYNGSYTITGRPLATTFTYDLRDPLPAGTATAVLAGYSQRQVTVSTAYCRAGNTTAQCAQQSLNMTPATFAVSRIQRAAGGTIATATTAAASLLPLSVGDYVTMQGITLFPEFNGYVQILAKPTATTFTYAVAAGPLVNSFAGGMSFVLIGGAFAHPPLHAAEFNTLAYNPTVTYLPPIKANGLPLTNTGTDANGNYGTTAALYNSASVDRDPFSAFETLAGEPPMWAATVKDNLNLKVQVPVYCNTDWPYLVNDANFPGGPNGIKVDDVGDANGQSNATSGSWCRINGNSYAVSVASGAPAALADYNYPWSASSGANLAKNFRLLLTSKTLYCDLSSPYRPRNPAVITGCRTGLPTTTPGPTVQQRCNKLSNVCNTDPALRNYTPAACKTDPPNLYCAPGTGGSGANTPGTGTPLECMSCTCNNDMPRDEGRCSVQTATVCHAPYGLPAGANPSCPDVPSTTITGCVDGAAAIIYQAVNPTCTGGLGGLLWNPALNAPSATTPYADSNGAGLLCRHNNLAYAVTGVPAAGGLATYPRTLLGDATAANQLLGQTGTFTFATTSGCPVVGTTVAIPRHYYQIATIPASSPPASVQFCPSFVVTANDQWRGFGTGVCQEKNDLQQYKHVKYGQFTRIDLFAANPVPFPLNGDGVARVWLAGTPTPDNSESVNYANWYAYYSTRLSAGKTTSSIAFSYLTAPATEPIQYRVGFHNFGDESPPNGIDATGASIKFVNVNDWDLPQRTAWYNAMFGIAVNLQKTPTMNAMLRIGNLFETGSAAGVDATVTPLPAGTTDPITVSCQSNYHILFTDGKTNQNGLPTAATEQDATIPASLVALSGSGATVDQVIPSFTAVGPWPRPFVQGDPATPNTLSDIATYYWARDLKPAMTNDVPSHSGVRVALTCDPAALPDCNFPGPGIYAPGDYYYPDLDPAKDVAWWQHVSFSAISFGAEGLLDAAVQPTTMAGVQAGTLNWPNLTRPNNPLYPKGAAQGAVAVDDLWHATSMSRGSFVYARTPQDVAIGLSGILAGIGNQFKARSGVAFNGQVLDATNNVIFVPTIEPGWAGDLIKKDIDPLTGAEQTRWWNAATTLATQIKPAFLGDEPWMDETKRRIVTLTGSTGPGVPFRLASLTAAQKLSLAPAPLGNTLRQEMVIAFLRGGNTFTLPGPVVVPIEGTRFRQFRDRKGARLGDISNAQPVIVAPPDRNYTDPGYGRPDTPGSGFAYDNGPLGSLRATRVVAPANDGMVHVFDAGPMPPSLALGGGTEIFAYIPKALFRGVAGNFATEDVTALQALAYQDGGIPIYHHHMYVDSSPRAADVDFSGGAGTDWRTIVVGGLGKGGNSYYALDLTDPDALDEAAAAAKVLWEWSDPEVKYSYGRPVIVKVRDSAYPHGRWVVIVTGGYNNTSGLGKIFFLDATNGNLLSTVTTSVGSAGSPSGLAQTHAFVKNQNNQIAEQIYGGDLEGNLWRVDVALDDQYKSATAVLFARLVDPDTGASQPVTTAPQIEIDINNGIDRYVFIGTGRLLHDSDLTMSHVATDPQTQTMYAIRDGTLNDIQTVGLPVTRADLQPINADGVSAIAGGAPNGWYHDLPNVVGDAQRIVVDVQSNVNIAQYIGTRVQDDPCLLSLPANLYARDYTTGKSLLQDSGGTIVSSLFLPQGAVGAITIGRKQADGSLSLGVLVSGEIPGTTPYNLQNPVTGPGSRLSWRLLGTE